MDGGDALGPFLAARKVRNSEKSQEKLLGESVRVSPRDSLTSRFGAALSAVP